MGALPVIRAFLAARPRGISQRLAIAAAFAVLTIVIVCVLAAVEWRHSAALVAQRRAEGAADAAVAAFKRDMRGVQVNVLMPARIEDPSDVFDRVTSGFARYPYPELFFRWSNPTATASTVTLYARPTRYPSWLSLSAGNPYVPVVSSSASAEASPLVELLRQDALASRRLALGTLDIGSQHYQVVA